MICIVTGRRDSGKSTRLLSLYRLQGMGDGIFMPKAFSPGGEVTGYDVVRLSSGGGKPLVRRLTALPPGWDAVQRLGRFSFSASGMAFAGEVMEEILARDVNPVYMDEIGPLEMAGLGFAPLLHRLLGARRDLVLAVRSRLLAPLVSTFRLTEVRVVIVRPGSQV